MSLTNHQWKEMYKAAKEIESANESIRKSDKTQCKYQVRCANIAVEVRRIKELIQSVIELDKNENQN